MYGRRRRPQVSAQDLYHPERSHGPVHRKRRRPREAGPVAVRRRHEPLGHDAAADDARRPSRADDPARDPLRARPDQRPATRATATPEAALGGDEGAREWEDFGFTDDRGARPGCGRGPGLDAGRGGARFYEAYADAQGKPRWGDKTPDYVGQMRQIQRALPEARFVHVIRDGRDVALSRRSTGRSATSTPPTSRSAGSGRSRRPATSAPKLAHYIEVRYEDLIPDTEPTLRRICEFIELTGTTGCSTTTSAPASGSTEMARALPADGRTRTELDVERRMAKHAMTTKPPDADRVSRWKREMSEADRAAFEEVAGAHARRARLRDRRPGRRRVESGAR